MRHDTLRVAIVCGGMLACVVVSPSDLSAQEKAQSAAADKSPSAPPPINPKNASTLPTADDLMKVPVTTLAPGGVDIRPKLQLPTADDEAAERGMQNFASFNCVGCHANGGGGIGPPLIKQQWTYGGEPQNLFDTIVKGRPNGMPSWGDRIPEYQIWQIVAYIRSMNGKQPTSATPTRADTIETNPQNIVNRTTGVTK